MREVRVCRTNRIENRAFEVAFASVQDERADENAERHRDEHGEGDGSGDGRSDAGDMRQTEHGGDCQGKQRASRCGTNLGAPSGSELGDQSYDGRLHAAQRSRRRGKGRLMFRCCWRVTHLRSRSALHLARSEYENGGGSTWQTSATFRSSGIAIISAGFVRIRRRLMCTRSTR